MGRMEVPGGHMVGIIPDQKPEKQPEKENKEVKRRTPVKHEK